MMTLIAMTLMSQTFANSAHAGMAEIKGCLKQAFDRDTPFYQVAEDKSDTGYSRYLVLLCNKDAAKQLFTTISGASSEGDWTGRTRGQVKYLGENNGASMCYHITRDENGEVTDDYNCSIRLNIDPKHLAKTESSAMIPFPLK